MAEIFKFFNSAPGDARWHTASDFADYFGSVLSSGVLPLNKNYRPGETVNMEYGLSVGAQFNTMQTFFRTVGKALILGYSYEYTGGNKMFTHRYDDSLHDRIDRIVLRLDLRNQERSIKAFVKEGVASSNPQPPELTRNATIYEISLAQVRVRGGRPNISNNDIIDERANEDVCGIVQSLITVPTSVFQQQFNAWFDTYKDNATDDFNTWFASIENILNDNAAGNLLREIQALDNKKADKTEVNALATGKADKTEVEKKVDRAYFDMIVASLVDGGPRELFYSVAALQAKYPNGEVGTYLVFDSAFTHGAHAYMWNGTVWEDLGVYQANGVTDEQLLLSDNIARTKQVPTFNGGKITAITHRKIIDNAIVRTDSFVFSPTTIIETRTLANNKNITISTNLKTLETVVS